ncbi:DNA helicase UvrB [Enterococcus faecalis]|jgi:hypothetical protein|nr:DNA helicase UvrB [Enterococcus faecalis]
MYNNFAPLPIGVKDAILGICIFVILGLTVFCKWTWWEFCITIAVVCLAYFAGSMKQVKSK